jgi:hypothetical protein
LMLAAASSLRLRTRTWGQSCASVLRFAGDPPGCIASIQVCAPDSEALDFADCAHDLDYILIPVQVGHRPRGTAPAIDGVGRQTGLGVGPWHRIRVCRRALALILDRLAYAHQSDRDCQCVTTCCRRRVHGTISLLESPYHDNATPQHCIIGGKLCV